MNTHTLPSQHNTSWPKRLLEGVQRLADLLGREEWILPPASLRSLQRQAAAGARHLGVLAAYRDLERARWRLLVPLQPSQPNRLRIRASARALGLADMTAADGMLR